MAIYTQKTEDDLVTVATFSNWVSIEHSNPEGSDNVTLTRDEAIAAARAILLHFNAELEAPQ